MQILVIEDDIEASRYLSENLVSHGHRVETAADGKRGLALAKSKTYNVLVVDRMLPELDGLSIIRNLRSQNINTPAMVLSALGQVDHRIEGLRAGGDDYLVKPYAFSELHARLEALTRRTAPPDTTLLTVGDLELNLVNHKVCRQGQAIRLQPREFCLLEYLMRHAGQIMTRTMLLQQVWDINFDPKTNVIEAHISRLRRKIDNDFDVCLIHTVRGVGYYLGERA